ncbi:hypothetical protein C7S15_7922 [Burkholderia cepacia]|nr:hypothetical protein [Burkholderia cepacia]
MTGSPGNRTLAAVQSCSRAVVQSCSRQESSPCGDARVTGMSERTPGACRRGAKQAR